MDERIKATQEFISAWMTGLITPEEALNGISRAIFARPLNPSAEELAECEADATGRNV